MTPPTFLNDITFMLFKNVNRIYAKLSELHVCFLNVEFNYAELGIFLLN